MEELVDLMHGIFFFLVGQGGAIPGTKLKGVGGLTCYIGLEIRKQ